MIKCRLVVKGEDHNKFFTLPAVPPVGSRVKVHHSMYLICDIMFESDNGEVLLVAGEIGVVY